MRVSTSLAAIGLVLLPLAASAADLPSRKAPPAAPPPPPTTWTGVYAGLDLGGGWRDRGGSGGIVGGGQVGYNYQFTPFLVGGFETDFQGTSLSSYGPAGRTIEYFGTVRGRAGVTPFDPRLLIYGTGGFAYGQVSYNTGNNNRNGWAAGGGAEWAITPNFSAKVEYLRVQLNTTDLSWGVGRWLGKTAFNVVRVGANYHFDVFPPAPFLARR